MSSLLRERGDIALEEFFREQFNSQLSVCMGANRGASRLSPSLAYATGITNAYMKCAG